MSLDEESFQLFISNTSTKTLMNFDFRREIQSRIQDMYKKAFGKMSERVRDVSFYKGSLHFVLDEEKYTIFRVKGTFIPSEYMCNFEVWGSYEPEASQESINRKTWLKENKEKIFTEALKVYEEYHVPVYGNE